MYNLDIRRYSYLLFSCLYSITLEIAFIIYEQPLHYLIIDILYYNIIDHINVQKKFTIVFSFLFLF